MSKSNTFENDLLQLIFNNVDIADIGDAGGLQNSATAGSLYIALHTGDPGEASPATIADAVWDEILSAHNIAGSTGEKLSKLLEKIQFLYLKD